MEHRELSWRERGRLWLRLAIRAAMVGLVLVAALAFGPRVLSLLMPFVLALFMAWLLNPVVRWLQRRLKLKRGLLTGLLLLLLFVVVGGGLFAFLYTVLGELASLVSNWPAIWENLQTQIAEVTDYFSGVFNLLPEEAAHVAGEVITKISDWLQSMVPPMLSAVGAHLLPVATGLPSWIVAAVVFVMATYFTTADYPRLRFLVTERVPTEFHGFWSKVKGAAVNALGGYLRAQLILSLAVFFILLIGYVVIGQSYALVLALILAVMDFIPIIGAGTAMVPWALVDFITGDYRHGIGLLVIWGVIVIFRRVAEPKVVGNQTGLSPILSLMSIYVGMRLGGVLGMILGPVLCMICISMAQDGLLKNTAGDLGLAMRDLSALLKGRPNDLRK